MASLKDLTRLVSRKIVHRNAKKNHSKINTFITVCS